MADFTKTSTPIWHIDDTYANVAAVLLKERIQPKEIMFSIDSETSSQVVVFIKRGRYP